MNEYLLIYNITIDFRIESNINEDKPLGSVPASPQTQQPQMENSSKIRSARAKKNPASPSNSQNDTSPKVSFLSSPNEVEVSEDYLTLKKQLGRSTWTLLHSIAANYPDNPTPEYQSNVQNLFQSLSMVYPCEVCAIGMRDFLIKLPIKVFNQFYYIYI